MAFYVQKVGNKFYIRYANNQANVFSSDYAQLTAECLSCCPHSFLTLWEDPNLVCNDPKITHPITLSSPYYNLTQASSPPTSAFSILCGSPPEANFSSRVEIKIPYDSIFSGTYVFDWKPSNGQWVFNNAISETSLSVYSDISSPRNNQKLISLAETSGEQTYKGYVEVARSGDDNSNLSGVFAFPSRFVFSAIQPPNDASSQSPFPTGSGHRAIMGFNLPIRWRGEYNDWIVSDAGGHKVSGSKYAKGWESSNPNSWTPSTNLSISGFATSISGANIIGLSGITNNPARYDLSNTTTAITGVCTGLAYMGFCYKTSASGLPFDNSSYGISISNFTGVRQQYGKYTVPGGYTLDTTRMYKNKQDMEAWITFSFSCRTSGTMCNEFDFISPVTTGYTTTSGNCFGSYVNADFVCGDNKTRPDSSYFTTEGITGIKVVYSGTAANTYPLVKSSLASGNLYKASTNQVIYIDYNQDNTPDAFRTWINNEVNFVEVDVNNAITRKYPGVDVYWWKPDATTIWARLLPCDSAAYESMSAGTYVIRINNINSWDSAGGPTSEFFGQYSYNSDSNIYTSVFDPNIQMRFSVDTWQLGKVENGSFVVYYILQNVTGGLPTLLEPDFVDYSNYYTTSQLTWNDIQLPVSCKSIPNGEWSSTGYAGTGTAISVKDPLAGGSDGSLQC